MINAAGRRLPTAARTARLLFWPLLMLAIASVALELGVWKVEETLQAPFSREAGDTHYAYVVPVGREQPLECCLDPRGDTNVHSMQSDLRLWINGREMGPAHTDHETIRNGQTTAFSHWQDVLYFSLPAELANRGATRATVRYSLRPPRGMTWLLIGLTVLLS